MEVPAEARHSLLVIGVGYVTMAHGPLCVAVRLESYAGLRGDPYSGKLLVGEGFAGVEAGGFDGGIEAEEKPRQHRKAEGDENGLRGDGGLPPVGPLGKVLGQEAAYPVTGGDPDNDPDDAAGDGQKQGFPYELHQDVEGSGADGLANADLADSLTNRRQQNVHDADAGNDQSDQSDGAERFLEGLGRLFLLLEKLILSALGMIDKEGDI